jgi:hypothetical protein
MVYKHAISTVVPARMVKIPGPGQTDFSEHEESKQENIETNAT